MTVKLPTNVPEAAVEKPLENKLAETTSAESKFDPFHPEMPKIPGVSDGSYPPRRSSNALDAQRLLQIGGIVAAAVLVGALIFWRVKSTPRGIAETSPEAEVAEQLAPVLPTASFRAPLHDGPTEAATLEELSKPWAARKFVFVRPVTQQTINAIVIRLPGGGLWAFALQGSADRCELEFVTDLPTLAAKYGFNAAHPMVVSPCDRTVYDPLKVATLGENTWVRGEIIQGNGLRPPISIDVKVRGHEIVADRIE